VPTPGPSKARDEQVGPLGALAHGIRFAVISLFLTGRRTRIGRESRRLLEGGKGRTTKCHSATLASATSDARNWRSSAADVAREAPPSIADLKRY